MIQKAIQEKISFYGHIGTQDVFDVQRRVNRRRKRKVKTPAPTVDGSLVHQSLSKKIETQLSLF